MSELPSLSHYFHEGLTVGANPEQDRRVEVGTVLRAIRTEVVGTIVIHSSLAITSPHEILLVLVRLRGSEGKPGNPVRLVGYLPTDVPVVFATTADSLGTAPSGKG